ncbi:MAG: bacteriocin family protein [Syntrophales bacterium]|jgi:uncharacterized linocin/CFP29 family protein|nr:bacteriocin family protein [Syntrophales bacterium]MDY0044888.1 family 1 encapsulin nanocompartment shell protein [Syntrophales bacterium]
MDILKRSLAPITEAAWKEIDNQAKKLLQPLLSARRVVDVDGPKGWGYGAVTLGRLEIPGSQPVAGIDFGVHKVLPLVEARAFFDLDIWELDNLVRGSKDIDLGSMDEAARSIALFEENAIYSGFDEGRIEGIKKAAVHDPVGFTGGAEQILKTVAEGITTLLKNSVEGPFALVLNSEVWSYISSFPGYPLSDHLKRLLDGKLIVSPFMDECYLLSIRGGDMILTLGQDLSVGYQSNDNRLVRLFFTESFTFQVVDPAVILPIEWRR